MMKYLATVCLTKKEIVVRKLNEYIFFYYTLHLQLDTSHRDECYDCIILISTIPSKPEKAVSSYMRTLKDTLLSTTAAKHNIFFSTLNYSLLLQKQSYKI